MVGFDKALARLHERIEVKLPVIKDGVRAIKYFTDKGTKTNSTLVFSTGQALLSAKAEINLPFVPYHTIPEIPPALTNYERAGFFPICLV